MSAIRGFWDLLLKWKLQLLIISALFLGILWRVFLAETILFWGDELWAYFFATQKYNFWQHLLTPLDDRPPVFYLMIKMLAAVSNNQVWLRLPSLVAGAILTSWLTYFFWQRSKILATFMAVLSSSYYFFVVTAAQSRDYGILILPAWWLISMALVWLENLATGLEIKDLSWKKWLSWSIAILIGGSLNYVYLPFFGAVLASLLLIGSYYFAKTPAQRPLIKIWFFGLFASLIPAILMLIYYLITSEQLHYLVLTTSYIPDPKLNDGLNLLINWFGLGVNSQHAISSVVAPENLGVLIVGCVGLFFGWYLAWKHKIWRNFLIFGWLVLGFNLGVVFLASHFSSTSFFLIKFFSPASVVSFILICLAIYHIWLSLTKPLKLIMLVSLGVYFWFFYLNQLNQELKIFGNPAIDNLENKLFIQKIAEIYQPGDQIIFTPLNSDQIFWKYFFDNQKYVNSNFLVNSIRPSQLDFSSWPIGLDFVPGTNLIIGATGPDNDVPPSQIELDLEYPLYPSDLVYLNDLCLEPPEKIAGYFSGTIWSCRIKTNIKIFQSRYILD